MGLGLGGTVGSDSSTRSHLWPADRGALVPFDLVSLLHYLRDRAPRLGCLYHGVLLAGSAEGHLDGSRAGQRLGDLLRHRFLD